MLFECCGRLAQDGRGEVLIPLRHCWRDVFFCVGLDNKSLRHDWASHCLILFYFLDALFVFGLLPPRLPRLRTAALQVGLCMSSRKSISSGQRIIRYRHRMIPLFTLGEDFRFYDSPRFLMKAHDANVGYTTCL